VVVGCAIGLVATACRPGRPSIAPPDKPLLAFMSQREDVFQISLISPDGEDRVELPTDDRKGGDPQWSPDGTMLVWVVESELNTDLYLLNLMTGEGLRIADHPKSDRWPFWSPDSRSVGYMSERHEEGEPEQWDLMIYDIATGETRNLTDSPDRGEGFGDWSPDGSRIAFVTDHAVQRDILVMSADGSGEVNITNLPSDDREPSWSPDGTLIAFESNRGTLGPFDIWVMRPDGSSPRNLTRQLTGNQHADWAPDGTRLVYESRRDGQSEIYVTEVESGASSRLTDDPGEDTDPTWSPDGTTIAFVADRDGDGTSEIWLMDVDGGNQRQLIGDAVRGWSARWRPAGSP
jgi:TolB protein